MNINPEELARLFIDGEDAQGLKQILGYLETHTRKELFTDILTPTMYHIGVLWERNDISVADEHLATAICDFILSATEKRNPEPDQSRGKAMVLGLEGEDHYLGLKMVSSIFRENDWTVQYLGPNLPLEHALEAASRWQPKVIGLSAALAYRLPALKTYIRAFQQLDNPPAVLIGGRAMKLADMTALEQEGAIVVQDLDELEQWIQSGKEHLHEKHNFI